MVDLAGKIVSKAGWAGPLLWVCTDDGYSIHLFDAPIKLDGLELTAGQESVTTLAGRRIAGISHSSKNMSVSFDPDAVLEVARSDVETARVFKKHDPGPHHVYRDGALIEEID